MNQGVSGPVQDPAAAQARSMAANTLAGMSRRLAPWIMLFALLWHAMAGAAGAWMSDVHHDDHAAMHWLDEGHHHDDDGAIHQDESAASVQHMVADGCAHGNCLLPSHAGTLPLGSTQPLPEAVAVGLPAPFLDSPRRPPRSPR